MLLKSNFLVAAMKLVKLIYEGSKHNEMPTQHKELYSYKEEDEGHSGKKEVFRLAFIACRNISAFHLKKSQGRPSEDYRL
jgi:hypothetical protein